MSMRRTPCGNMLYDEYEGVGGLPEPLNHSFRVLLEDKGCCFNALDYKN
jgi:hypothetical protein